MKERANQDLASLLCDLNLLSWVRHAKKPQVVTQQICAQHQTYESRRLLEQDKNQHPKSVFTRDRGQCD